MTQHPGDEPSPDDEDSPRSDDEDNPVQGQVRHSQLSARVPSDIGSGAFSNGVMILTGPYEIVLDFALRLGEQQKIVSRVILPHVVARQFVAALQDNVQNFENRFGPMPQIPKPIPEANPPAPGTELANADPATAAAGDVSGPPSHPENQPAAPNPPHIEDIYHELKLADEMLSGRYANAVLIRHSPAEFCFDFITNVYPRSAVSARVLMSAPHVVPFLRSLSRSLTPPETGNEGIA